MRTNTITVVLGLVLVSLAACGPDYETACENRCRTLEVCEGANFGACEQSCEDSFSELYAVGEACADSGYEAMVCLNRTVLSCIPVFENVDCRKLYYKATQSCYKDVVSLVDAAGNSER